MITRIHTGHKTKNGSAAAGIGNTDLFRRNINATFFTQYRTSFAVAFVTGAVAVF